MHDTIVKYYQSVPEIVSSGVLPKENNKQEETGFGIKDSIKVDATSFINQQIS